MATYRHWSVSLWWDPDDVPHCRILSPDKTEWRLISATLRGWRRCFVADQLWFMTRIAEEDQCDVLSTHCLAVFFRSLSWFFCTFYAWFSYWPSDGCVNVQIVRKELPLPACSRSLALPAFRSLGARIREILQRLFPWRTGYFRDVPLTFGLSTLLRQLNFPPLFLQYMYLSSVSETIQKPPLGEAQTALRKHKNLTIANRSRVSCAHYTVSRKKVPLIFLLIDSNDSITCFCSTRLLASWYVCVGKMYVLTILMLTKVCDKVVYYHLFCLDFIFVT